MASVQTDRERTVASLAKGIIADSQTLLREELALARQELLKSFIKFGWAGAFLLGALPFLGLGALMAGFTLEAVLHQYAFPNQEWACYLIVGGLFLVGTAGLAWGGALKLIRVHIIPRITVRTLQQDKQAVVAALSNERATTADQR